MFLAPSQGLRALSYAKITLEFWEPKLEENRKRDIRNQRKLRSAGWQLLIVWECELERPDALEEKIARFLDEG